MNGLILFQALIFGIISIIIGLLISIPFQSFKPELPEVCKEWNKYYIMEISLFFVGFILRFTIELPILNNILST